MHHGIATVVAILGGSPIEAARDDSLMAMGGVVGPSLSRSFVL